MSSWYDAFAQWLISAPMLVQVLVVLAIAIPICGVCGVIVVRVTDFLAVGFRARNRSRNAAGSMRRVSRPAEGAVIVEEEEPRSYKDSEVG